MSPKQCIYEYMAIQFTGIVCQAERKLDANIASTDWFVESKGCMQAAMKDLVRGQCERGEAGKLYQESRLTWFCSSELQVNCR